MPQKKRVPKDPIRCLVMMRFEKEFNAVYSIIKNVNAGPTIKFIRLDESSHPGRITDELTGEIAKSKFCIADLSGLNPNVMWEAGYAMALQKPMVFICKKGTKLPFDIQDMRVIFYDRTSLDSTLRPTIRESIKTTIQQLSTNETNDGQYSNPFTIKLHKPKRLEREITMRLLTTENSDLTMNFRTFGDGVAFLHDQIDHYQPALKPDLYIGIRNVGGAMAALIGGRISGFEKPILVLRVDPKPDEPPAHFLIEQFVFIGESNPQSIFSDTFRSFSNVEDALKHLNKSRNTIKSIMLFDQEVKSGSSLKSVINYLKKEFPMAANQIYLAVLVASRVQQKIKGRAINDLYTLLTNYGKFKMEKEYLPDFLAFVNCGKRSKLYINNGRID